MNDCLFCKIVAGDIPSTKIYENDHVLAFLDIHPVNHGHTLVIPKEHFEDIYQIPNETLEKVTPVLKKMAVAVKRAVHAEGINLVQNNEKPAGQEVPHFHVHIIPRYNKDTYPSWEHGSYKDNEQQEVAEKIKNALD